jgi:AcrR family transcriptional regulator
MSDPRTRIIEATARCYAQYGSRGATTRRIADEAGVNEITIFRHFGSKEALLELVTREWAAVQEPPSLPMSPIDPVSEISDWVTHQYRQLSQWSPFIRRTLGESSEHPDASKATCESSTYTSAHLFAYVLRLQDVGFLIDTQLTAEVDRRYACTMLTSSLFSDAVWREVMPQMFPGTPDEAISAYVRLFAQAIGLRAEFTRSSASTAAPLGDVALVP